VNLKQLAEDVNHICELYTEKFGIEPDANWFVLKLQEEVGELTQAYLMLTGQARTKGNSPEELRAAFREEVADVFCQVLLLARHYDIDLEREVDEKWLSWNP
jgi:NTP pyrophosphatase (non-canonical NTP hydrolase)